LAGAAPEELARITETVVGVTRKPVLVGISPDSTTEAMRLAGRALAAGASGLLVRQPHYLFQPDPSGLADMFRALRKAARVPLFASNTLDNALIDLASLRALMEDGLVDGICQGRDPHLLTDLLSLAPRAPVFSAIEELMYVALILGAEGVMSDLAAVFPDDCVALYQACRSQDHSAARTIHDRLLRIWHVLDHPVQFLARLKHASTAMDNPAGVPRSPYDWLPPEGRDVVNGVLRQEGKLA
jgi:4-hydroxy-tetrahydrodipicolinate synthase